MPTKKVIRVCVRWKEYVSKYKQVVVYTDDGPAVRKMPIEWQRRCIEYKNVLVDPRGRIGMRQEYIPKEYHHKQAERQRYQTVMKAEEARMTMPRPGNPRVEYEGLCECRCKR